MLKNLPEQVAMTVSSWETQKHWTSQSISWIKGFTQRKDAIEKAIVSLK